MTYANVLSTLCLFLLLGGGSAYALVVTGTMVADESLTDADIRNGSLDPAIGPSAVDSGNVLDNSLTGFDVNESTLGTVPRASRAPVEGLTRATRQSELNSTSTKQVRASCPAGRRVVGGGHRLTTSSTGGSASIDVVRQLTVVSSRPESIFGEDGWTVSAVEDESTDGAWAIEVYALCAAAG